jgi:hypothetical protein
MTRFISDMFLRILAMSVMGSIVIAAVLALSACLAVDRAPAPEPEPPMAPDG